MLEIGPGSTCLQKVRLAARGRDPLLLQLRLSSALQAATFHPSGLPAEAILCVRRLAFPSTKALLLEEARLPSAWEQALTASLETITSQAYRPALGVLPGDVPAVLFADRAELLACLSRDWLDGRLAACWWWRSLLAELPTAQTVISAWTKAPEHVPGALEMLAQWKMATRFVRAIEPAVADCMLENMVQRFGLKNLQAAWSYPHDKPSTAELSVGLQFGSEGRDTPDLSGEISPKRVGFSPLWQACAPESAAPDLHLTQQLLLGVGLSLRRAPQLVRSAGFAAAVRATFLDSTSAQREPGMNTPSPPSRNPSISLMPDLATSQSVPSGEEPSPAGAPVYPTQLPDKDEAALPGRGQAPQEQFHSIAEAPILYPPDLDPNRARHPSDRPGEAPVSPDLQIPIGGDRSSEAQPRPGKELVTREEPASPTPSSTMPPAVSFQAEFNPVAPLQGELLETRLGGLFYLINLALFLELYADFTAPLRPGIALPIWDFVALVGERLLGGREISDPVWKLLAHLAGRAAGQPAGRDFEPAPAWRMPPAWLEAFPERSWEWSISRGQLTVRHPAGFSILDVPSETDPTGQLERELLSYQPCQVLPVSRHGRPIPAGEPARQPDLAGWLDRFVEYASARLCRALGLESLDALPDCLCLHLARVRLTSTHLDITFNLASHPLAIRLAGLDRNPGWVPAGGRYIVFHYE
jgi:hypothetical protein